MKSIYGVIPHYAERDGFSPDKALRFYRDFVQVYYFLLEERMNSSVLQEEEFKQEFKYYKLQFAETTKPKTALESLKNCSKNVYPNVHTMLKVGSEIEAQYFDEVFSTFWFWNFQIACTIPVTTCTPERCFSVLRRLKTYLRARMLTPRLNGLAMLSINHYEIDTEDLLKSTWMNACRRRIFEKL